MLKFRKDDLEIRACNYCKCLSESGCNGDQLLNIEVTRFSATAKGADPCIFERIARAQSMHRLIFAATRVCVTLQLEMRIAFVTQR
jgi:hypothetical protein